MEIKKRYKILLKKRGFRSLKQVKINKIFRIFTKKALSPFQLTNKSGSCIVWTVRRKTQKISAI